MHFEVVGHVAQYARITMARGETCWISKGGIVSYQQGIEWSLRVPGGVAGAARRVLSGEGVGLGFLEASKDGALATVAGSLPGKVVAWDLADGPVITTRGSFLAAWGDVQITVTIARRAGAAFFGGAGLFLQQISGDGTALIHASGDLDDRLLASGESLTVSTGHLAAFTASADYDIRYVGGVRKALFSGEGLFMTHLTGPGRVLLQSLKRRQDATPRG